MIKRAQLAAEALAAWTGEALRDGQRSLARQELPAIDVQTFFRAFAESGDALPQGVSLALVGFGVDQAALKSMARKAGATCFTEFATDLHAAAKWRNDRRNHPIIVAYARGTVAGVNTLRHFAQASSRELTLTLLRWAVGRREFSATLAHTRLLTDVQSLVQEGDAFSFEQVRSFLETWSQGTGPNAPRNALPALGLLPDPNLFAAPTLIRARLESNADFMSALRDRSTGFMDAIRKRLSKADEKKNSKAEIRARLRTFEKLQAIRRNPNIANLAAVPLDDALRVFAPTPKADPEPADQNRTTDPESRTLNPRRLHKETTEALLDNRAEDLEKNADALSKAVREGLERGEESGDEDHWQSDVSFDGEAAEFETELDRSFVAWVRHFCKPDTWGGLIETTVPDLRRSLEDFDRPDTLTLNPEALLQQGGKSLGLTTMLKEWEDELSAQGKGRVELVALWTKLKRLRAELLGSLEELTHFPLEWFAGKANVRGTAEEYLRVTGQLFGAVAKNYGAVAQNDARLAKTTLEGLLALDVVQARVRQPDDKTASKAVLLPTHPLHLWRYCRLSTLLRGLGKELSDADRPAVIQEASESVQFLSVIYASPLPGGRGARQVLPIANDLYRLATFENLRNAYNGPDGQSTLVYSAERFAAAHRHHVNPLRLVLVNPPQAGPLLLDLLRLLDDRKRSILPRLRVEVRGTPLQGARLREALLFDTREREIIEEKVASGQLELLVDRTPKPLDEILDEMKARPVHIVAVFDEAPVTVRRGGAGERLPMSPFCVRRKVAFHKRWNELRLEPTSGDPPFFEFIELVKHVEGNEGDGTPYAWPEAEALRKAVDKVLTTDDFGAQWFFLADRALPEEGEMQAQRLVRRREGQRQVLLAARDHEALARLMLPVFEVDTPNLLMPVRRLQELLAEGAHLVGAGILDVVKSQEGRVVPAKVIGLMGTLLAARNYLRRHPGALLVSTDSQLARTWLRLGTQGDRCDLLAVREDGANLVVECIEVKTTKGKPRGHVEPEISRAREQVAATLAAVREGLGDTTAADASGRYLAAPRNEMLKEVLVQGCMGRFAEVEDRSRWAGWLGRLFGSAPEMPEMRGIVVDVALGSAEEVKGDVMAKDKLAVRLEHLNEVDVQRLLEPVEAASDTGNDDGGTPPITDFVRPLPVPPGAEPPSTARVPVGPSTSAKGTAEVVEPIAKPVTVSTSSEPAATASPRIQWPPHENVFGLIGQEAAATKLNNKVDLAQGTGRRFTDTLFIGPAGVGKSSLARAVSERLVSEEPLFFSGSDLPQPSALVDKLKERKKVAARARGRVRVGRCLVFIDEVHALAKSTATALLSAMDDARIASIGGVEYDFSDVVFIAATTDKGLLTDAFVSRMDQIPLAPYSLDELAGIIWHHGRKQFRGFELPRDVCLEVAARNRCNPRRAVRSLENDLLAEFYSRLTAAQRKQKNSERVAATLMTVDDVARYYDGHGVDLNGLDDLSKKTLAYLRTQGASSEERLSRGLRISNRADFVELVEYLTRLGLLTTGHGGRQLTPAGRRYITDPSNLRARI